MGARMFGVRFARFYGAHFTRTFLTIANPYGAVKDFFLDFFNPIPAQPRSHLELTKAELTESLLRLGIEATEEKAAGGWLGFAIAMHPPPIRLLHSDRQLSRR